MIADISLTHADGTVTRFPVGGTAGYWGWHGIMNDTFSAETVGTAQDTTGAAGHNTYYYLADHLGTTTMELTSGGWPLYIGDFAPYGQEIIDGAVSSAPTDTSSNHYKFTGKERDAESGLDYFGARYYASSMGRWMSPDWADKPEAVPYSSLGDPQSLNLYGYVGNNPLSKADPDGHCPTCIEEALEWAAETPAGEQISAWGATGMGALGAGLGAAGGYIQTHLDSIGVSGPVAGIPSSATGTYTPATMNDIQASMQSQPQAPAPNASPSGQTNSPTGPDGPYKRPNNATTKEQRGSVQGKPCATCGASGQKNNADHKDPLVEQHYRGGVQPNKSPDAVRPQCPTCSAQQGGYLKQFSTAMKKLFGFN
jgi:RHS repeat-associated protein